MMETCRGLTAYGLPLPLEKIIQSGVRDGPKIILRTCPPHSDLNPHLLAGFSDLHEGIDDDYFFSYFFKVDWGDQD
jgi:hypothetical protein